jgi:hypothetical protein
MPASAGVLAGGEQADVIRRREMFADVFGRDEIPTRLVGLGVGAGARQQAATPVGGGRAQRSSVC